MWELSETIGERDCNRVDRVLGFFSSRPNWDSPSPSPTGECVAPSFGSGRGTVHTAMGRGGGGGGGPGSDEGETLWYTLGKYVLCGVGKYCSSGQGTEDERGTEQALLDKEKEDCSSWEGKRVHPPHERRIVEARAPQITVQRESPRLQCAD
jgi:hypothetical protein